MVRRSPSRAGIALLIAAAGLLLTGCFTGKRPHFENDKPFEPGSATGDSVVDAMLVKLDSAAASPGTFTATYDVLRKYDPVTTPATVSVDGASRVVDFQTVRYVQTPGSSSTCKVAGAATTCSAGLDSASISGTGVTVEFYAAEAAKRLRRDVVSKAGPTDATTESIAGVEVSCVSVPQIDVMQRVGKAVYCVLPDGVLARLDDGDVAITLTSFEATVDPNVFTTA